MRGKKLIALLVVLVLCILTTIMAIVIAFLVANQFNQNKKIDELMQQANQAQAVTNTTTNTTNTTTPTTPTEPTESTWTVNSKSDTTETSSYKIDILYPELKNTSQQSTADDVNAYIKALILPYKNDVMGIAPDGYSAKASISLDYDVKYLSNNLVSIVITGNQYLGGAHPGSVDIVVNYDLKNNTALDLTDVFNTGSNYLAEFSVNYRAALAAQMGVSSSDSQLVGGTSPSVANFKLFYFSGNENVTKFGMIFGDYQVAPYAAGPQTVELDVEHVSGSFTSEFTSLL